MRRTTSLERIMRRLSSKRSDLLHQSLDKHWQFPDGIEGQVKPPNVQYRNDQNKRIRRTRNELPVAFVATLKQHLTNLGAHQPITFENVVTNIGNAYNNTSGSFIAPVPGIYVFSTTLFSHYHVNYHAQIYKNGQPLTIMYLTGGEAGHATSSQTIVLQLNKGDDVSVRSFEEDKPLFGVNYSTFSGFLLQEDVSSPAVVGK